MRLHHPYLNGGGDDIGKNHMDKCQPDRLMYQMLIAMFLSKLKMSMCLDNIRSESAADLLRTYRRLVVVKRMF